ncbi:hydrogenase maturation factor HypE [Scopulibacillus daqui]|uniref:Hydrogenase maturation factor HypE n=1 Tax=Scopulibacillus daqui TaxID=1469162 RepID=A0ABS2Q3T8_9BACL|nr:hypothetical protein [Scopulibacillus daqui]MBM7646966.1 hydrogenase maturation factor HypE [Scopulibacillus daqui]
MSANKKESSKEKNTFNFIDPFWDNLATGLNAIFASQERVENLTIKALEYQKTTLEKFTGNLNKIEEEQSKLVQEVRQNMKQNIEKAAGEESGKTFEEWNERLDDVMSRIQKLTVTPYKANLNLLNQSQKQFEGFIKKAVETQEKNREQLKPLVEESINQLKTTHKGFYDVFESNANAALSLIK